MPFRRRYFQPGAPGHATPVHLERLSGMRQQFVVNVPLFRSRSPRPMARRPPPLRLLPSQAPTRSERAHATATRPHTRRRPNKAPLAIRTGSPTSLEGEFAGEAYWRLMNGESSTGRLAHPCGLARNCKSLPGDPRGITTAHLNKYKKSIKNTEGAPGSVFEPGFWC
jgi:hypothetical protein